MSVINVLPKAVSELIAAGEVVERPSSVIKELVENSIDAGATLITVEIKNGGVTFMRVTDNGCGIAREDVTTAFLRHATSKLKSEDDLNQIMTLGFRGEALAAISSVSRVEMLTKPRSAEVGTLYTSEGAGNVNVNDAGCPDGTTIIIKDLFYNTPARMKFLKKDVAEGNSVGAVMDHIALSHPEISFRFIRDGKSVFMTPGDGKLMSAIYAVCGREFAASLIPVDHELGGIQITGYVCRPAECRPKKNAQFVFLNGRYVRSGTVSQALDSAYKNLAMVGRFPAAVLHLTVPYGAVDVNVHPAKTEVRFSDERRIFECVMFGVKNAIAAGDTHPELKIPARKGQIRMTAGEYRQTVLPETEKKKSDPIAAYAQMISNASKNSASAFRENGVGAGYRLNVPAANGSRKAAGAMFSQDDTPVPRERKTGAGYPINGSDSDDNKKKETAMFAQEDIPVLQKEKDAPAALSEMGDAEKPQAEEPPQITELIGEIFSTYIIARRGDSVYLIDKHAAHERIIFNRLKATEQSVPQFLLTPEQVHLTPDDYTAVLDNLPLLEKAGFEVEDFGDGAVLVRSVPSVLSGEDVKALLFEVAASLADKNAVEVSRLERIYETVACRSAVKAGNLSSGEELQALADAVLSSKDFMYCPHGRPVAVELKKREIEKQFGRIQ